MLSVCLRQFLLTYFRSTFLQQEIFVWCGIDGLAILSEYRSSAVKGTIDGRHEEEGKEAINHDS